MLVLSRKLNEEIRIDGGITLKVTEIHRGRVRLGIDAPSSVSIDRAEVVDQPGPPVSSTATDDV